MPGSSPILRRGALSVALCLSCEAPPQPNSEPADPVVEAADAPFDRGAAHKEAFASARSHMLDLGRRLAAVEPPLTSPERTELIELLASASRDTEGIDPSFLEPKASAELRAYTLLSRRAQAYIHSRTPLRVDPQHAPRTLRRAIACAEAGIAQRGTIAPSCSFAWHRAARAVDSLRAASRPALTAAQEASVELCERLEAVSTSEVWASWAAQELPRCRQVLGHLKGAKFADGATATDAAWSDTRSGRGADPTLTLATDFPPPPLLVNWFALTSGWEGSQHQPHRRGHRALVALQVRTASTDSGGSTPRPFEQAACRTHVESLGRLTQATEPAPSVDCERLALAAEGRQFGPGEQASWTLRRAYLDRPERDERTADDLLTTLDSPVRAALAHLELDLLERAGLEDAANGARRALLQRLCASMALGKAMTGGAPEVPDACSSKTLDAAKGDPVGALMDLELTFLDLSAPVSKRLLEAPWLPLGWRVMASTREDEPAAPKAPVRLKTELEQKLGTESP